MDPFHYKLGVPAAFAGACHAQVPHYIKHYDDFKAKGINEIYVVAVNDAFVTWYVPGCLKVLHENPSFGPT